MNISKNIKDKIKAVDLAEYISKYTKLKKSGAHFSGRCPFPSHKDGNPSFCVIPEKSYFKCHGCKKHGDIIDFYSIMNKTNFQETVQRLAKEFGISIKSEASGSNGNKHEIFKINIEALNFFKCQLGKSQEAQNYLKDRGVSIQIAKSMNIGFAPDKWQSIHKALKDKFSTDKLINAGLVRRKNKRTFDFFRNRIIFPIQRNGNTTGFIGRDITDHQECKYLNSPKNVFIKRSESL